jgi:hypothetical protein
MTAPSDPLRPRPVCDFGLEDLRQSTRFRKEPGTDFAVIWRPGGEEVLAEVYDESLTGICLVLADTSQFPVGTLAELIYHATPLHGEVRHVTPQPDGSFLVGFACERWPPAT